MDLATLTPLEFDCPRCHNPASQRLYGPCAACVDALHLKYTGEARAVETEEYVPKMNVTPNSVATKD